MSETKLVALPIRDESGRWYEAVSVPVDLLERIREALWGQDVAPKYKLHDDEVEAIEARVAKLVIVETARAANV